MWISGFSTVFLGLLLPETYADTILLKRARRLRKLTGNPNLRSPSEVEESTMSHREFLYETLVRPIVLATEPAVLFCNVYLGLVCKSPVHIIDRSDANFWRSADSVFYLWVSCSDDTSIIIFSWPFSLRRSLWFSMRSIISISASGVYHSPVLSLLEA